MGNPGNGDRQPKGEATPAENPLSSYGAASWPLARFDRGNWSSGVPLGPQIGVQRFWSVRKLRAAYDQGYEVRFSGWRWLWVYLTRWPMLVVMAVWASSFLPVWGEVPALRVVVLLAVALVTNLKDFSRAQRRAADRWLARRGLTSV